MIDPSAAPDPPLGFPDPPRSRLEFWVRFGFGFLFGSLLGLLVCIRFFRFSYAPGWWWWLGFPVGGAFVCAMLAAKFGDRFWTWFRLWWYD